MSLTPELQEQIIRFVKKEPRAIQDISLEIGKSWVTADSYVEQVKERTGLINIKVFRKGSQGAVKVVYYNYSESLVGESVKEDLFSKIKICRKKQDFDFLEVFQFVPEPGKKAFFESYKDKTVATKQHIIEFLEGATSSVYYFSGNLSFVNMIEGKQKVIDVIEALLARGVRFKIICRVTVSSVSNISKLIPLMKRYPGQIEIRHAYQPLRGYILDDKVARFINEESISDYKSGELPKDVRMFCEIYDEEWVGWLQKVFWALFRTSIDHEDRLKMIKKYF